MENHIDTRLSKFIKKSNTLGDWKDKLQLFVLCVGVPIITLLILFGSLFIMSFSKNEIINIGIYMLINMLVTMPIIYALFMWILHLRPNAFLFFTDRIKDIKNNVPYKREIWLFKQFAPSLKDIEQINYPNKNEILNDLIQFPQLARLPIIRDLYNDNPEISTIQDSHSRNLLIKARDKIQSGEFKVDWSYSCWAGGYFLVLLVILLPTFFILTYPSNLKIELLKFTTLFMLVQLIYMAYNHLNEIKLKNQGYIFFEPKKPSANWKAKLYEIFEDDENTDKLLKILESDYKKTYLLDRLVEKENIHLAMDKEFVKELLGVELHLKIEQELRESTLSAISQYLPQETENAGKWHFNTNNQNNWGEAYITALSGKIHHSLTQKKLEY